MADEKESDDSWNTTALEVLEHQEIEASFVTDVVQRANVRMVERRDRARLAIEPIAQLRIGGELRGQHFDRDGAIEPRIARAIHLAHPTAAKQRQDLVSTEASAGSEGHRAIRVNGCRRL